MMRPLRRLVLLSLLLLVTFGTTQAMAQPVSDDEDVVDPYDSDDGETVSDDGSGDPSGQHDPANPVFRIGVLQMRPTFEAQQRIPEPIRARIDQNILTTTQEINFTENTVMPFDNVMKFLGPRERKNYMKCWLNPACLAKVLAPANLDIAVASKIRLVEIDKSKFVDDDGKRLQLEGTGSIFDKSATEEQFFAEYTLFVRLVDLKRGRILKEILVKHTDIGRIPDMGQAAYRQALMELGFIVDRPLGAATVGDGDDAGAVPITEVVAPEPVRNVGMKAAAWTTFGLGIVSEALGLTFGVLSNNAQSDAEKATTIDGMRSADSDRKTYMLTSNIMYGVGGALLISSAVLFVLGYSNDDVVGSGSDAPYPPQDPSLTGGGLMLMPEGGFMLQAQGRF